MGGSEPAQGACHLVVEGFGRLTEQVVHEQLLQGASTRPTPPLARLQVSDTDVLVNLHPINMLPAKAPMAHAKIVGDWPVAWHAPSDE